MAVKARCRFNWGSRAFAKHDSVVFLVLGIVAKNAADDRNGEVLAAQ